MPALVIAELLAAGRPALPPGLGGPATTAGCLHNTNFYG